MIPDYLNYNNAPVSAEFPLVVYPTPQLNSLESFGPLSNSTVGRPARGDLYTIKCRPTADNTRLYLTTCNLTIANATVDDKGFYNLTLGNDYGQISFRFQLDVNGSREYP